MWNWFKLLMPLSLSMADDGGGGGAGGAAGGDGADAADAPTPVGEDHFAEMVKQQEMRAGLPAEGTGDGDTDADTAAGETGKSGTETADGAGESATKATDTGKDKAAGDYVPKARFDEVLGELKDLKATIAELKKGTQQTTTAEPAWKSQLKALPSRDGYMKDGKLQEWGSTEEYLDARQDALNHNAKVESDAKAAETKATADAQAAQQKREADAAAWRKNYTEKTVPEFLKAEGITAEQFGEAVKNAPSIPILDAATGDSIGAAIQQLSKDAARFTYAISTATAEALTPYAAEVMAAAPGPARTAKIIEVVGRMDALLTHGLGFDGKPRANGGAGAKGLTTGGASERSPAQRASRTTTVVTGTEGGGGTGGAETATGEAHFNHLRAKHTRKMQAQVAGLKR